MGDLVDLDAFRAKKEAEEADAKEEQDTQEVNYMRTLLDQLLASLGGLASGSIMVVPLSSSDTDFTYYSSESGYNTDGYYEEERWELDSYSEEWYENDNIRPFPPGEDDDV